MGTVTLAAAPVAERRAVYTDASPMTTDARFFLQLLGPFAVRPVGGQRAPRLNRKTAAILAYLAATGASHSRRALANLFCQEANDPAGTLRWHLSQMRRRLAPEILRVEGRQVALNPDAVRVDVAEFEAQVGQTERLSDAVALYRGDFLEGVDLRDAPEFEIWILGERARLRRLYTRALTELIEQHVAAGRYDAAIALAQTLLQSDSLREDVHARLMWLYAATGRRDDALHQFDICRTLLQRELAVEPGPELLDLRARVLAGETFGIAPAPSVVARPPVPQTVAPSPALVGRDAELAQLDALWQETQQSTGQVVLVHAEAGGGKTSLVRAFGKSLADVRFLVGHCYESTRTMPYRPWIDLLEQQYAHTDRAILDRLPAYWLEQLARLLPVLAVQRERQLLPATSGQREHLFAAVVEFLLVSSTQTPLLIFLDDLQWADEASLQLFHFVARRLARPTRSRTTLIGAYRTEEAEDNPALLTLLHDLRRSGRTHEMALQALSAPDVEALIARLWPELPPGFRTPHVRDALLAETGGNPLFLTEILQELAGAETLPESMPVPRSLRQLVQRRLGQLPGSSRQVVEALAVLGAPATFDRLRTISGRSEEETDAAVDLGLRWRLVQTLPGAPQVHIDFSHDLMREAVLAQTSAIRRQHLHRRTARTLERERAAAAVLAYHWGQAGDETQAGRYAMQAARDAAQTFAVDEAIRHFQRALELDLEPEARLQAFLEVGYLYEKTGQLDRAEQSVRTALLLAQEREDVKAQAGCEVALSRVLRMQGKHERALPWLEAAQERFSAADDREGLSRVYGSFGALYWSKLRYDEAIAMFEKQLRLAQEIEDRTTMCAAFGSLGVVAAEMGKCAEALHYYGQQLALALELGNLMELNKAVSGHAILYAYVGNYAAALACYARQVRQALDLGHWLSLGVALGNVVDVFYDQGQYARASEFANRAIRIMRTLNVPLYLCGNLHALAKVHCRQRNYQAAQERNDEAYSMAAPIERRDIEFSAQVLACRLQVHRDEIDTAAGLAKLEALRAHWPDAEEQAAIDYAMWRLDSRLEAVRQRSAARYINLYRRSPNVLFRRRYAELTGNRLPDPDFPPPPHAVTAPPDLLDALLDEVDRAIAELTA